MPPKAKEGRALATLEALAETAPSTVSRARLDIRAAALILSNSLLLEGSRIWGRAVVEAPRRMDRLTAIDAVCVMADQRLKLDAAAEAIDGRPTSDPAVFAFRWEIIANEVVTLTVGASLSPEAAQAMLRCWKSLWDARRFCDEALRLIAHYEKSYSAEATPRINGRKPSRELLSRLGSTLPPMFRTSKASNGGAGSSRGRIAASG
jgi:hypothetical protein